MNSLGRERIERHEAELTNHALERLRTVPGLRLIGPATSERRVPVFSFTMDAIGPRALLQRLDALGIAIRAGDLSALPLLKRFGTSAAARASCYFYTSTTEIDRLADALRDITASAAR